MSDYDFSMFGMEDDEIDALISSVCIFCGGPTTYFEAMTKDPAEGWMLYRSCNDCQPLATPDPSSTH